MNRRQLLALWGGGVLAVHLPTPQQVYETPRIRQAVVYDQSDNRLYVWEPGGWVPII